MANMKPAKYILGKLTSLARIRNKMSVLNRIVKIIIQFSSSVVSDSLRPHGLQHARLPYSLLTPRACSNSCPASSVMPSNHLILCRPLLPPSIFPSIRVFSNESVLCIRCPKYWSFSFSICPSNEYSGYYLSRGLFLL